MFIQRCFVEYYKNRKKRLLKYYSMVKTNPNLFFPRQKTEIHNIVAEMVIDRLSDIEEFIKRDKDNILPEQKEEWLSKASSWLGIPHEIPIRKWEELVNYPWPGNYREVRSIIYKVIAEGGWQHAILDAEEVQEDRIDELLQKLAELYLPVSASGEYKESDTGLEHLRNMLRDALVKRAIDICHGSRKEVASILGMSTDWVSKNPTYQQSKEAEEDPTEDDNSPEEN